MTTLSESPDSTAEITVEEIDFSKYRTKELANEIADLVGLPKSLFKLVCVAVICLLLGTGAVYAAMRIDDQNSFAMMLSQAYAIPTSLLFAIALWIVLMVRKGLSSLTKIVDLLLCATVKVARDYRELYGGRKKLPPMAKLVGAVYEHVFMHAFRECLSSATGVLGAPVYWAYRLTIDRMLKMVVRFVATKTASEEAKSDMKELIDESMLEIADEESSIISGLEWSRETLVGSGNWLARKILWPCYAMIVLFFTLLAAPFVAVLILG